MLKTITRDKYIKNYDYLRIFVDINLKFIVDIMKLRNISIAILAALTVGCSNSNITTNNEITTGVSYELAQERKANISDIHYDICFVIPQNLDEDVSCDTRITFTLKERQDVVIDFRDTERIQDIFFNNICYFI